MKSSDVKIFCGLREGYTDKVHSKGTALNICQDYCNRIGLCVTVTDTVYVYKGGSEPGIIVGLIRYPRFPETDIWTLGVALGWELKTALRQFRVTVMDADNVVMLGDG